MFAVRDETVTIEKLIDYLKSVEEQSILFWAIVTREEGKHIGNIKIDPIDMESKFGEYGIMLGDKTEWGKGYAKEASERIVQYCFSDEVDLRKVNLGVVEDNHDAVELYKKLGFEIEGVYRLHVLSLIHI